MRQASALTSPWTRGFITWLVYTGAGVLALGLASPQDHVEPLYLSAGFGLACVLGWGKSIVLPVGLGSASVLTIAHWHAQDPVDFWPFAALALVTGLGGALQAWVAARWSMRGGDQDLPLEHPFDIGRFLLVAGPVSCLINAGVSVPAMVALGALPASQATQAALSWWAGDTLGVLIGTPMMLTLVGRPVDLWRARRLIVGVPLLVTTLLLGLTIRQVQLWEEERAQAVFDHDVEAVANAVNLRLNGYLNALEALHGLYIASSEVSRQEFRLASTYWLNTLSGIQAMGWTERLTLDQIPSFEGRQHAEGLRQYQIHDTRARLVPKGPEVAAVRFLEPMRGNEKALGYNSLSSPAARDAFEQSRREDRPAVTKGLELAQESGHQTGVVIYRAVYQGQPYTPQARVQSTLGAVFLALRMDDMIKAMTQGLPSYLSACLMDASQGAPAFLGGATRCSKGVPDQKQAYQSVTPIEFAGRQWRLVTWAHAPVPVVAGLAWSWLLAIGGVVLAAALGALLLVITGHTRRVEAAMDVARRQKAAAETANRSKSEFLSRMSHELRTPLNAVLGFAQVMDLDKQSPLTPTQSQRLQQIQQAGWHLLDMIDDVLDLSRIDTGTLKLNTEVVSINEAAMAAMDMVRELAQKQKVQLLDPDPAPAGWGVKADAIRLRQILINLLSNAIKYNRPGGTVKVSMGMASLPGQDDCIRLAVEDTGLGMNPEQLAQLFQPFNRLGRERVAPDGAGIGLVISQHLAQLMDGQLDVQSTEDKGSTFTLTLPAAKLLMPKPVAPPPAPAPTSVITKVNQPVRHVLYVEDNHVNSEVVRGALASRAWIRLTVAPTIEEGLAVLHDRLTGPAPDLVLLDVHLPDASGLEFLTLMKANPQTAATPVIMISADAMPEQVDAALSAGAYCYLTKPVQLPALLVHVDDLLATHT